MVISCFLKNPSTLNSRSRKYNSSITCMPISTTTAWISHAFFHILTHTHMSKQMFYMVASNLQLPKKFLGQVKAFVFRRASHQIRTCGTIICSPFPSFLTCKMLTPGQLLDFLNCILYRIISQKNWKVSIELWCSLSRLNTHFATGIKMRALHSRQRRCMGVHKPCFTSSPCTL